MAKLLFVGDIVMNTGEEVSLSDEVNAIFTQYDIKCCNFEGPIVNSEIVYSRKIGPSIKQSNRAPENIINIGFNCICLANNHIYDCGYKGLQDTIKAFSSVDVLGAGDNIESVYKPIIKTINGKRIGMLNVAENGFGCAEINASNCGYAWMFHPSMDKKIVEIKEQCDFLVIVCHGGLEKVNYPLPEYRETYRRFIDDGADVIIAHHPHVVQGWEFYKNGFIAYSLGNFIWQKSTNYNPNTIMIGIDIKKNSEYCVSVYNVCQKNNTIVLCNDEVFKQEVEKYCSILSSEEEYLEKINIECDKIYENSYKNYYLLASGLIPGNSIKSRIKNALRVFRYGNRNNEMLLYHNIVIETHLWTCKRALKNRLKLE